MKILLAQYSDHSGDVEVYDKTITPELEHLLEWLKEHKYMDWLTEEVAHESQL